MNTTTRTMATTLRPKEQEARNVMNPAFDAYIKKHGYHMTDEVADEASRWLKNRDGSSHLWRTEEVRRAMTGIGVKLKGNWTWGDLAYLANMNYSDLSTRMSEVELLKMSADTMDDPDGYDGMVMHRWVSDMIGRGKSLDLTKYL